MAFIIWIVMQYYLIHFVAQNVLFLTTGALSVGSFVSLTPLPTFSALSYVPTPQDFPGSFV